MIVRGSVAWAASQPGRPRRSGRLSARRAGTTLAVQKVSPIPTANYPTPATRPLNSRLDTQRLRSRFGLHLADWRDGVVRMLAEIG